MRHRWFWLVGAAVLVAAATAPAVAQPTFAKATAGVVARVTRHDLTAMAPSPLNASLQIRKVMGDVGTFMIGEFKAGWSSTPHHHSYEQINVGLTGGYTMPLAGTPHRVTTRQGVLIPSNVTHNNDVSGATENALAIEFQNLRRVDFPPEREKLELPRGPVAVPVPDGRQVALDFTNTSAGWSAASAGVRVKTVSGVSSAVTALEIAPSGDATELVRRLPRSEQFVYIVEGTAEATEGSVRHALAAGTLLVTPPGSAPVRVRGGTTPAFLLVFEALPVPGR
jgi:quercetin dioxygenase-like cupin family protein